MSTVPLCVMKWKREEQTVREEPFSISAPNQKRVVENIPVHSNSVLDFGVDDRGCADNPALIGKVTVLATFCNRTCVNQVLFIIFHQIFNKKKIA